MKGLLAALTIAVAICAASSARGYDGALAYPEFAARRAPLVRTIRAVRRAKCLRPLTFRHRAWEIAPRWRAHNLALQGRRLARARARESRCRPPALSLARYSRIPSWRRGAWACIHHGEGSWTANTGNGYHGGLQMDASFMLTYGHDAVRRWGWAENWPWYAQVIVADRAYRRGRGFYPWPTTARRCGLI